MNNWYTQDSDKTLQHNEIHIWLNYLNLHEARIKHLYPLLSDQEKERSERFKFYKHRKNFITSHGFLHTVLAYYLQTPADEITFSQSEFGKPFITPEQNPQNIQFNLSHANNLAILAVCKQQVGIDVEYKDRKSDWQGIIKRFFTPDEQAAILALDEKQQKDAFYQVWTRKEAHMKVTGQGLHLAPDKFQVSVPPREAEFLGNIDQADTQFYKMQDIHLPAMYTDYSACLSASFAFDKITQFIHS